MTPQQYRRVCEIFDQLANDEYDRAMERLGSAVFESEELIVRSEVRRLLESHHELCERGSSSVDSSDKEKDTGKALARSISEEITDEIHHTKPIAAPGDVTGGAEGVSREGSFSTAAIQWIEPLRGTLRRSIRWARNSRFVAICSVVAALMLGFGWLQRSIVSASNEYTQQLLVTIAEQQSASLSRWIEGEFRLARSLALNPKVTDLISRINQAELDERHDHRKDLKRVIQSLAKEGQSGIRFTVWNREERLIADSNLDLPVFETGPTEYGATLLSRVLAGESVLWVPSSLGYVTRNYAAARPDLAAAGDVGKPTLGMLVPVYVDQSKTEDPYAVLMIFGVVEIDEVSDLLEKARPSETGETYLVDARGYQVTRSRFGEHLKRASLTDPERTKERESVSFQPTATWPGHLRVADPGVNTYVEKPDFEHRDIWTLTESARRVIRGRSGDRLEPYPDYRGVPVVGAWRWIDEYRLGLITEMDAQDAGRLVTPLVRASRWLMVVSILGLTIATLQNVRDVFRRMRLGIDPHIGSYRILEKLGEGGMAEVYLAEHSVLNRRAAVKRIKPELANERNRFRFQREITLASRLQHPNTIEIYDFGETSNGSFYCAMEYISGLTLQQLVKQHGKQPQARVAHFLLQCCRSLREAHTGGLIHRDLKPANLMVYAAAEEYDHIKVLDFGLVRDLENAETIEATATEALVGTPMYIAPERIINPQCMDRRVDIYSLGMTAYVLLQGHPPFEGLDTMETLAATMHGKVSPWKPLDDDPLNPAFVALVMECLAKSADARPSSVDEIIERLESMAWDRPWCRERAAIWWNREHSV
ncbi:MAG: serine/threonine protein kinase [Planctomycetota bacterium]